MAPTFASAAAGNNSGSSRTDSPGDWARRANGATQTFRRPSHAPALSGSTPTVSSRDGGASGNTSTPNPGVYVPPHAQSGRNGSSVESRYSKDQLTQLFRAQRDSEEIKDNLRDLYVGSWEPSIPNGASTATWGRRDDNSGPGQGVDICWDKDGSVVPLSLTEMTEEEKENFSSSVNSPLKPPVPNANKDGAPKDPLSLRKSSISHSQTGNYSLSSPTATRPGNRRRDTSEAFPFQSNSTASPAATSRFGREESNTVTPPPALVRRRTDFKDSGAAVPSEDREKEKSGTEGTGPLGTLKRTTTAPFGAVSGSGSPWSATTPGGAFGAFGSFASPQTEKRPGLGSVRGESRFKGLMSKASSEDISKGAKEKPSFSNLGRASEVDSNKQSLSWMGARSNRPTSNDTDPFPEDEQRTGSAALGGGRDTSPHRSQGTGNFGTPQKQEQRGESGFSAFGMTSDTGGLRDIYQRENYSQQTPQARGGPGGGQQEPMSPTNTNPYQSPDHEQNDNDDESDGSDIQQPPNYPGISNFQLDPTIGTGLHSFGGFGNPGRVPAAFEAAASDRSQTSSTGPSRGFPTIPGLGTLPGLGSSSTWSSTQPAVGTPVRDRAFGGGFENVFGSVGEVQSPSLAGLGSTSLYGPGSLGGSGTIGRGSKMGSLFSAALQEQMRVGEHHRPSVDEGSTEGDRPPSLTGSLSRNAFGSQGAIPSRDTDSPFRSARGIFDEFPGSLEGGSRNDSIGSGFGQMTSSAPGQPGGVSTAGLGQTRAVQQTSLGQPQTVNSPVSNQPQQRCMVMPDRMRWIYRDPQGNTQGPWSGLEMHDWYKAGFFSPELLVKKFEDPEYEPLAQLIRRIGNSREPFLVPQIGIPHGPPPSTQPGNAWGTGIGTTAGGAQPPFANSFPSFGTTLTAEQQNALERRKQEEQYLMARQKEHLAAQQQALAKQASMGIGPHGILPNQLHHHSSAHSLHSQPSFGSITSPGGYQPSPTHGPVSGGPLPGVFDNSFRPAPVPGLGAIGGPGMDMLGHIREEDMPGMMERLNLGRAAGQIPYGTAPLPFGQQQPESNANAQQVVAMLSDRARLQREQAEHDALQRAPQNEQQAAQASADRLQQFHDLRIQTDMEQPSSTVSSPPEGVIGRPVKLSVEQQQQQAEIESAVAKAENHGAPPGVETSSSKAEPLSLTEQVQKAASAKQSPQPQSPWAKVEAPAIHPFPPPPSQSPLPAPAAQRKQNLADSLAPESRSRSETPSVETPSASIAPWAKEPADAPKGPSLKEIQEAEARKAAKQEEMLAAARRAALEKEMLAQAQSPAAQPGLPSSSTWASGASPITPSAGNQSAWAKPLAGKPAGVPPPATKKTLQQIQKEEEARKLRAAATAAAAISASVLGNATQSVAGKRYADLAGKHTPVQANNGDGGWAKVGPSGKVKLAASVPTGPSISRPTNSNVMPAVAAKTKPATARSTNNTQVTGQQNAHDEFRKWAVAELRPALNSGINVEDFVSTLLCFPSELEVVMEAVHSASTTIDSRHFAQEYLRRHKLADKGIVDTSHTHTSSPLEAKAGTGDGWNTVAKKGIQNTAQQQETLDSGMFKVVAAKKKGGKR